MGVQTNSLRPTFLGMYHKKMNKLKHSLAYLAGPMDRVPDGGVKWRVMISNKLMQMGIGVLNPCDKPTNFAKETEHTRNHTNLLKKDGLFNSVKSIMKPICNIDLRFVDIAHFLVVYIDTDVHMAGTYHELSLAITQKKPTLLMCKQGKNNIPNWWFGVVPNELMFSSWDELLSYLHKIDSGENIDDLNRWRFLDFDKIYGI